jgi:hypothetical protein
MGVPSTFLEIYRPYPGSFAVVGKPSHPEDEWGRFMSSRYLF